MNVIDVPYALLTRHAARQTGDREGPDVGVGDDTGADGGVTDGGADASLTLKGTDVFTLPTSAVVVASRAQTATRCPPVVVGLQVYVFEELQLLTTVQVVSLSTNHLN